MHTNGCCGTSSSSVRALALALAALAWLSGCDSGAGQVAPNGGRDGGPGAGRPDDIGEGIGRAEHDGGCGGGSPVAAENCLAGTADWRLKNAAAQHEVEGYASAVSAAAGDEIALFVNVDHAQRVRWELYRHGYYQTLGGRLVATGDAKDVAPQPACPLDTETGMIECSWKRSFKVAIDPAWVTGYYTFKLINQEGFEAEIPLIVRESGRRAPLLVQATVTTWQAYNSWGGTSFYKNLLPAESGFTPSKASQVSFDRPYSYLNSIQPVLTAFAWLEEKGYDVAYVTNLDSDADSQLLSGRKVFLSVGHDEYVTQAERDELVAARDEGVSLIFASANDIYRHIGLAPSTSGTPMRVMYRDKGFPGGREAGSDILGNSWDNWSDQYLLPFVVTHADHWIYEGTGVKDFDVIGNVIGAEWGTVMPGMSEPDGLEIVSASPTIMTAGAPRYLSNATLYYPTNHSLVFSAATICWGYGLSAAPSFDDVWGVADPRFQRMMENVLKRAGLPPLEPTTVEPPPAVDTGSRVDARVIAGGDELDESGAVVESLAAPVGLATGPDGLLYVADSSGFIRRISADGKINTLAGCAPDAPEGSPCLTIPIGIAVSSDGTVYFSDSSDDRIYKLTRDGVVTPYAGDGSEGFADASDPLQASFAEPRGLALGPGGELYVADAHNGAIRRVDEAGVTTVARAVPGVAAVALGPNGDLYFSSMNCQVGEVTSGAAQVLACPSGVNGNHEGSGDTAHLRPMEGLLVDGDHLVFADTGNSRVRAVELDGDHAVSTVVGDDNVNPDLSTGAHLALPRGVVSYQGGYAISDSANHRILWVPSTR